jgi:hypothetical protein
LWLGALEPVYAELVFAGYGPQFVVFLGYLWRFYNVDVEQEQLQPSGIDGVADRIRGCESESLVRQAP